MFKEVDIPINSHIRENTTISEEKMTLSILELVGDYNQDLQKHLIKATIDYYLKKGK